jgi:transposase InsO family protein
MNQHEKRMRYEEVKELRYNKGLSIEDLADHYGRSPRTIYRWLCYANTPPPSHDPSKKRSFQRKRKYPREIFDYITELKQELPQRSAPMVLKLIKQRFPTKAPSLSTIRKYIRDQGLTYKQTPRKQGYLKFARTKPNDLWQIDIAGVQTVGHLEKLYLIALLDDCSRFIVAAQYFKTQKGVNILKLIRDAVLAYGRSNQILADNGTQFRNLIGELGTKYTRLLDILGIKPIFAKPHHPQTKGKLERWFGTVKQMFLVEARSRVASNPSWNLTDFNTIFHEWLAWYNTKKPHRSLPHKSPPATIYFSSPGRIFRPLQAQVNWERWLQQVEQRKVTKYNEISYKSQKYHIPPGYSLAKVEVIEYEDTIEIYYRDHLLITHPYNVPLNRVRKTRKITTSGTIMYKGTPYTIDYKLAGKTVEVQEINDGKNLLDYLNKVLLKTLTL